MYRKKMIVSLFFSIVIFSSCTTPLTSKIGIPIPTSTSLPTATATYIPITPVFSGTQVPTSSSVISVDNVDRLTLFARWGSGNVSRAQHTPDGKYLIVTSSTGIYFYDTQDYSLAKFIDLETAIFDIAITQDGQKMAVTSLDKVFIFNWNENKPLLTIAETVGSLAFSPNGQILAVGTYSWPAGGGFRPETIKLFDPISGNMLLEFKGDNFAQTIIFSPDGALIASGGYSTQTWSLDGKLLDTHGPFVSGGSTKSLSFSPDGTLLAEGADTVNILHVWRVLTNGRLVIFRTISLGNYPIVPIVFEVAISPDGKRLAAATSNGLFVWQLSSGGLIYHKNDNDGTQNHIRYYGVTWSPDSNSLVAISEQSGVEIWNMNNGELLQTLNNLTGAITGLTWSPNGKTIVRAMGNGGVSLIESHTGKILHTFESDSISNDFAVSPDGNWLAIKSRVFSGVGRVEILNLTDDNFYNVLEGSYGSGLAQGSFSQDGKYLVTSGFDMGQEIIQVWNTKDWSLYSAWKMDDELVGQLIFCPDGETIALVESRGSTIKFYKLANGKLAMNIELSAPVGSPRVNAITFSPDGTKLLTSSRDLETSDDVRKVLRIWQTGTENLIYLTKDIKGRQTLPSSPPYYSDISSSIDWSPNGELFAVGFSDGIVGVFRASDGKLLQSLSGHTLMVMGVTFSPNGQILASASLDGTVRLWGIK